MPQGRLCIWKKKRKVKYFLKVGEKKQGEKLSQHQEGFHVYVHL